MGIFYVPTEHGYQVSPESSALDIDGKPTRAFDFTLRGSWMNAVAQNAAKHMNLGYDLIISDYGPYFGGERYSFTAHTLKMFKQYFMAKYPALKYRARRNHPEFRTLSATTQNLGSVSNVISSRIIRKPWLKSHANCAQMQHGWVYAPFPAHLKNNLSRIDNLCDNQQFNAILDYNMPMLYNKLLYRNMQNYHNEVDLFQNMATGKRAVIFPTLTLDSGEKTIRFRRNTLFLLLETALTQCRGA